MSPSAHRVRTARLIGIAASALLLAATGSPAHAMTVFAAADVVCQGASVTDVTAAPGSQVGVMTGVVEKTVPGTLICELYVNGQGDHSSLDTRSAPSWCRSPSSAPPW